LEPEQNKNQGQPQQQSIPLDTILEWGGAALMREIIRAKALEQHAAELRQEVEKLRADVMKSDGKGVQPGR